MFIFDSSSKKNSNLARKNSGKRSIDTLVMMMMRRGPRQRRLAKDVACRGLNKAVLVQSAVGVIRTIVAGSERAHRQATVSTEEKAHDGFVRAGLASFSRINNAIYDATRFKNFGFKF